MPAKKAAKTTHQKSTSAPPAVLVPEVTPKRFYGHGLPGIDLAKLTGIHHLNVQDIGAQQTGMSVADFKAMLMMYQDL